MLFVGYLERMVKGSCQCDLALGLCNVHNSSVTDVGPFSFTNNDFIRTYYSNFYSSQLIIFYYY